MKCGKGSSNYGLKRRVRPDGYVDVWAPDHPIARADGYVFEHRKVAWDAGLLTDPTLQIHHLNEIRDDNRIENLAVLAGDVHTLHHLETRGFVRNQFGVFPVRPREVRWVTKTDRACSWCGFVISIDRRSDAVYCSASCRHASWRQGQREQVAA